MEDKAFDGHLVNEFSEAVTDLPIVKWFENTYLVCELCNM